MPDEPEKAKKSDAKDVLGIAIAMLGKQYLAIPLHDWLGLSRPLAFAIAVLCMGSFLRLWVGRRRGYLSDRGYALFIVLVAVGGYAFLDFRSHS